MNLLSRWISPGPKIVVLPPSGPQIAAEPVHAWQPLRTSFVALLALITGLVTGHAFALTSILPGVVVLCFSGALALFGSSRNRLVCFLVLFAGLGLFLQSRTELKRVQALEIREALFAENTELVQVSGVISLPVRSPLSGKTLWLAPGAEVACRGRIWSFPVPVVVWVSQLEEASNWRQGERVSLIGKPRPLATEGAGRTIDSYYSNQGAVMAFQARQRVGEIVPSGGAFNGLVNVARSLANAVEASYNRCLSPEHAAMISALTLGRTGGLSPELVTASRQIGITHIFSVSGLHTGIIGLGLIIMLRPILRPRYLPWVVLFVMLFFCAMVEFRSAALRSALLVVIVSFEPLMKRRLDSLSLLSTIALMILLLFPRTFWQVDFQLSFICAAVLMLLLPLFSPFLEALTKRLEEQSGVRWWSSPLAYVISTVLTSVLIQLLLAPILISSMGELSLIAPLANTVILFTMPIVLLYSLACAFIELLTGVGFLYDLQWIVTEFIIQATILLSKIPYASVPVPLQPMPQLVGVFYLVALASPWLQLRPAYRHLHGHRRLIYSGLFPILTLLLLVLFPRPQAATRVLFLDIGQGDATLILHRGRSILVDVGPPPGTQLVRELQEHGVQEIDLLALTHADADHIGGFPEFVQNFTFKELWINNSETAETLVKNLDEAGLVNVPLPPMEQVSQGEMLTLDASTTLSVLHPASDYVPENPRNDASLVMLFTRGTTDVLLTADAEAHAEARLVQKYGSSFSGIEVLKTGHHGSRTSSTPDFLAHVQPQITIMSCGLHNRYQHPHRDVMERFTAAGVDIYRTDLMGTITLELMSDQFTVHPERALALPSTATPINLPELFP